MKRVFSCGKRFIWNDRVFEVRKLLPNNRLNVVWLDEQEYQTLPARDLAIAQAHGELRQETLPAMQSIPRHLDWSDFSDTEHKVAKYRLEVIQPLVELDGVELREATQKRIDEIRKANQSVETPLDSRLTCCSMVSIWRWLRSYRLSGGDPRSLVPKRRTKTRESNRQCDSRALEIATGTIEDLRYQGRKLSVKSIWRETLLRIDEQNQGLVREEQIPDLSLSTVYRIVRDMDSDRTLLATRNKKNKPMKASQVGQMDYPDLPLARVEIDHTILDIVVVDDTYGVPLKRPTLTVMLDAATRYPLGFYIGFEPPSVLTVMSCLRHAILPKGDSKAKYGTTHDWIAYGIPYELVIDNGKEFTGSDLDDVCFELGITLTRSPVKTPQFKAAVERFFGTLNTTAIHALPGTTFSNIEERGDYDSVGKASMTLAALKRVLVRVIVDVYAQEHHTGIRDTPSGRWEEKTSQGFFPQTRSADELKFTLGRVAFRTVQHYGIEFLNLRYNSPELAPLRVRYKNKPNQKFKIKYDPEDLGNIRVLDPGQQSYIEVPALHQKYADGLTLWCHRVICARASQKRGRVNDRAIAEASREIQQEVQENLADTKRRRKLHAKEARWAGNRSVRPSPLVGGTNPEIGDDISPEEEFDFTEDELLAIEGELSPHPNIEDGYWQDLLLADELDEIEAENE